MSVLSVVGQRARVLHWRSLSVDLDRGTLRVAGLEIPVTGAESGLACCLLRHRGVPLCKDTILAWLFGPEHGRSSLQVDILVTRLQRALNQAGLNDFIVVVPNRGYAVGDEAPRSTQPHHAPEADGLLVAA